MNNKNTLDKKTITYKGKFREKGITLIALVVTIIILLILAGVTLNIALSQDGLFSKTQEAVDKYKQAQEDEELEIEKIEYAVDGKDITKVETISNKEDFKKFRDEVNTGDKSFENTLVKLYCDVDLSEETWEPIGTEAHPFNGVFNGNGYKITNLTINSNDEYQGLFGYSKGIIKKVGIESGSIKGGNFSGGIVAHNEGLVSNCYNKAEILVENLTNGSIGGIVR